MWKLSILPVVVFILRKNPLSRQNNKKHYLMRFKNSSRLHMVISPLLKNLILLKTSIKTSSISKHHLAMSSPIWKQNNSWISHLTWIHLMTISTQKIGPNYPHRWWNKHSWNTRIQTCWTYWLIMLTINLLIKVQTK